MALKGLGALGVTFGTAVMNRASGLSLPLRALPAGFHPDATPRLQRPGAAPRHWPAVGQQAAVGQPRFAVARRRCGGIRYIIVGCRLSC